MPELPDVTIYVEKLQERLIGEPLERLRLFRPFALRSVTPVPKDVELRLVQEVFRVGKRIVIGVQQNRFVVIHLMISGRFLWRDVTGAPAPGKIGVAAFDFPNGTLLLTEASSKRRASINLIEGRETIDAPPGADVFSISAGLFTEKLREKNQTVKRALTDPHRFDGIGNAYSDEILHSARLSPMKLTGSLTTPECEQLLLACRETLSIWTQRLREEFVGRFPKSGEITAFRPDFAAHGKFGQPCPVCGKPIQRIAYADNETNYCAVCQNGGRILADRALSRLLKSDFPRGFDDEA